MNSWITFLTHSLQNSQIAAEFVDAFLKSFVLLLAAGLVCLCWRRGAATNRHLIWSLVVTGLLVLPLLSGLLPAWQKPLWAVQTRANSDNELTFTLEFAPSQSATLARSAVDAAPGLAATTAGRPQMTGGRGLATQIQTTWTALVFSVWLAGTAVMLLWIVIGRWRLFQVRQSAQPQFNTEWLLLLDELRRKLRIQRQVTLLQSADDVMPVTWGWWHPVILLPAEANEWSPDRRRVVLLHELAHVKRWDCLTQQIARLACAVYWFNPLVWVAARRMCIERERACDDLVLIGGCKASEYAVHLLEIARSYRRMPQVAAIAMARSSQLEGRIAAIVDATRVRRRPRTLLWCLCMVSALAFTAVVAAQKPEANSPTPSNGTKPWYDARLRAYFVQKAAQAHQLAGRDSVPPEVWPFFEAGSHGDWQTATNLWVTMRKHAHQYDGTTPDNRLDKVWAPILEIDLAWEQFANWKEKYVLAYGNDIINSIPAGSIYFGGTDPGRGLITALSTSHAEGKPFYTLTQNALADGTYLDYLRAMYGPWIYTPTTDDSQKAFMAYTAAAQKRLEEHKLKPGEDVQKINGRVVVSGQVAVMNINALIVKTIFDHNPGQEFYIEESYPLDWMYPHLTPNGLIMKINRQPLERLSEEVVQQDHEYWSNYLKPMIGDWLQDNTSVAEIAAFTEKVYLQHDLGGFTGDPQFTEDQWAQKAFSKLRSSQAGVYAWRSNEAKNPEEKQRMTQAADFAFRQALALCPASPEAIYRYASLLCQVNRQSDALIVAETGLKFDAKNQQLKDLVEQLKSNQPSK